MIVLDTHAWIWWINNPEFLPRKANKCIDEAMRKKTINISSISVFEIALLVKKNRIQFTMNPREWIAKTEALPFVHFIPVDNTIALQSVQLENYPYPDPADRMIIATALMTNSILITKDERILKYPHIQTCWDS